LNEPTNTSSKYSSALMHCLLSLSAALQQLGVVLLGPQKRDEITREALYSLVEALVDPKAKRVSETWHRSNLLFVRKMLDAWDPTWPQATGTWQTRLEELTSVRFVVSDYPNPLTFPSRITRASRLNHNLMRCLRGLKCFWRSCSRHGLEPSIRLLLYCALASLQGDRSTILLLM
jgi:hypothetical protein